MVNNSNAYRSRYRGKLFIAIIVMLLAAALAELRIRPVVESIIRYESSAFALRAINDAIEQELSATEAGYNDIVRLTRGSDSAVLSIETDMKAVNLLKAKTANAIATVFEDENIRTLRIPAGTVFGGQLFSGRGPLIEIRVMPSGYINQELYNEFISAGINQTLHRIMLKSTAEMVAILPGFQVKSSVATSFCVAETVIVGKIPEGYTIVNGDDGSAIAKMNDYGIKQ